MICLVIIITILIAFGIPLWIVINIKEKQKQEQNDCPIKIGDYYLQMNGRRGVPILRKRVKVFKFDDLEKFFYYPYSDTDENFKKNVEQGHYMVISQENVKQVYKQYTNKNIR